MWKERWWNLNELIANERLEEEPAVDETTNTKEGKVEVLVYLPWSEFCPSLLPVLCVHVLKTAGDVVGNE